MKENAVYASSEIYVDFCHSIGLDLAAVDVCKQMVGKMQPHGTFTMGIALKSEAGHRSDYFR